MDTEELLRPVADDIVERGWWGRLFGMHPHCFHSVATSREDALYRKCCHCGRFEESKLTVVGGHGPYAPKGAEQTLVWSSWGTPPSPYFY